MGSTFIDITGEVYNELEAVEYTGKDRIWIWRCSCGKLCKARKNDVVSGKKKSCGHLLNKIPDLNKGDKFEDWTVIERDKKDNRKYICQCSCGTIRSINKYDLTSGKTKSCGHSSKGTGKNGRIEMENTQIGEWSIGKYLGNGEYECTCSCGKVRNLKGTYLRTGQSKSCGHATNAFKDITNQQFGDWTALIFLGDYQWWCRCKCGTERAVTTSDLYSGKSTSCGCSRFLDLSKRKFGKLQPIEYIGNRKWDCLCDCGNHTTVEASNLISHSTKSCGCLAEDKREILRNKIETFISNYEAQYNDLPTYQEIADGIDYHGVSGIKDWIDRFNLENKIDTTYSSYYEKEIVKVLGSDKVVLHNRNILSKGKEIDILIVGTNIGIEFNGDYWHSVLFKDAMYHTDKTIEAYRKGIKLIHIHEYEWKDKHKREILTAMLKGITGYEKIYARKTIVKEITQEEANQFNYEHNLYGIDAEATINIGTIFKNKLIGVMSFKKTSDKTFEITRNSWISHIRCLGGLSKMLKFFERNYETDEIITYTDISKFNGDSYAKVGFKTVGSILPECVLYCTIDDTVRPYKDITLAELKKAGYGKHGNSVDEILENIGYAKIFKSGKIKLSYKPT